MRVENHKFCSKNLRKRSVSLLFIYSLKSVGDPAVLEHSSIMKTPKLWVVFSLPGRYLQVQSVVFISGVAMCIRFDHRFRPLLAVLCRLLYERLRHVIKRCHLLVSASLRGSSNFFNDHLLLVILVELICPLHVIVKHKLQPWHWIAGKFLHSESRRLLTDYTWITQPGYVKVRVTVRSEIFSVPLTGFAISWSLCVFKIGARTPRV